MLLHDVARNRDMPNLVLLDKKETIKAIQDDAESTYRKFEPLLQRMPQVASGAVEIRQAQKWLDAASKTLKQSQVLRLIKESSGLTAHDIRALWAFDKGEYYPTYEAKEVYLLKNLEAIRAPSASVHEEGYLKAVLRQVAKSKYGFNDATSIKSSEQAREFAGKLPWALNIDSYLGESNGSQFAYDIKTDYVNKLSTKDILNQSDIIRHHFIQLAASNNLHDLSSSYQFNISVSPHTAKTISSMAGLDAEGFSLAIQIAKKAESSSDDVVIKKDSIQTKPEIFQQIIKTGDTHWNNMLNGIKPSFQKTQDVDLTTKQKSDYEEVAKKYAIARMMEAKAKEAFAEARELLPQTVQGVPAGFTSPYPAVLVGSRKEFDLDSAVLALSNSDIPEHFYKSVKYDIPALIKEAQIRGVDTGKYCSLGAPDKSKVVDSLEMIGIDKSTFESSSHHVHLSGQTRGQVHEHLNELRDVVEKQYTTIEQELLGNGSLDMNSHNLNLNGDSEQSHDFAPQVG